MTKSIWGLHMADIDAESPIENGFIGIGWPEMGDLSKLPNNREAFKAQMSRKYPEEKAGAIPVKAGVLFRFANEMEIGDLVVYPSKPDRIVHLGIIEGGYKYAAQFFGDYPHRRNVKWVRQMQRAEFSQSALYEIGSAITLFQVSKHADEFRSAFEGEAVVDQDLDDEAAAEVSLQVQESTEDFIIKRLKTKLSPYDFEKFIAHLLTCMGYYARVTQQSSDGGIDIIAHKDELGFEPPIIKVQCKQTLEPIGRPKVQELHGAIETGEHGLFVSLGQFSAEARAYDRTKPNLRLIDGATLVELIYNHYEKFYTRYKLLLPLKRAYIAGSAPETTE